ncbi:adenosine 5'-monophosphoramidase HINT2-like [Battus philenor]|uniref:adenosine 5'-monophosphoramidase HINT2-like n=1 Tax=Battus philenor TaxID=42288 RepID=UPI0035D025DA
MLNHKQKQEILNEVPLKNILYEDKQCVVYDEIFKNHTPMHFIVEPKKPISKLSQPSIEDEKLLGHLLRVANKIANQRGFHMNRYQVKIIEKPKPVLCIVPQSVLWPITPTSRL